LEPFLPETRQTLEDDGKAPTKREHAAHEPFISRATLADVPVTGLSLGRNIRLACGLCQFAAAVAAVRGAHKLFVLWQMVLQQNMWVKTAFSHGLSPEVLKVCTSLAVPIYRRVCRIASVVLAGSEPAAASLKRLAT